MKHLRTLLILLPVSVAPAFGASFQTWVASTGTDSGACPRTAPCKTFAYALTQTFPNGEIDAVDAADYGPVQILKSVTIEGHGVATIASGGASTTLCGFQPYGVCVDGASGPIVTLRNLSITLLGGSFGVYEGTSTLNNSGMIQIEAVNITTGGDCVNGASQLVLRDSALVNCGGAGVSLRGTSALLDNVLIQNCSDGVLVAGPNTPKVSIRNSNISEGANGINAQAPGAVITVESSTIWNNTFDGVEVFQNTVQLSNVTVTGNGTGLSVSGGGSIISFVNNRIYNNGTDGAPTKSVYQK